jgi:hypothetical protein
METLKVQLDAMQQRVIDDMQQIKQLKEEKLAIQAELKQTQDQIGLEAWWC